MGAWLSFSMWLVAAGPPAVIRPVSPQPPNGLRAGGVPSVHPAASFSVNVSPATITFSATDPDTAPVVAGSAPASVTWQNLDFNSGAWGLTVQANASTFSNCPTVPVSAVTVSCASASTSIGGSASCSAPFTLSTTAQTVASGSQSFLTYSYSVTLNFTLADNWKYIAETSPSCSLSLSYIANVP
jgi:hypothetical protein